MSLGPQSARDRQNENRFSREFASRALLAQAVSALSTGDIAYAAGRRYRVDPVGPDGLCIVERSWAGAFEQLQHRMQDGQAVRFACFGDSTTEGNQTTGGSVNPVNGSGQPIGTGAHTPAFAWPAVLQTILRRMYNNPTIQTWNAGYGGRAIVTGWARDNFRRAVIDNPAYGTPDACLVAFGLNDIMEGAYTPNAFYTQLVYIVNLMDFHGITPVFMQPDPVLQNTPRQAGSISELMSIYERVAKQFGIQVIDTHVALTEVFSSGGTNTLWALQQDDNLHFQDAGHRVKASFVAAKLFNKTLFVERGAETFSVGPFSKYANTQDLTYAVFDQANNRFGACANVGAGTYAPGQVLMEVWLWTASDEFDAFWRSVSGDGYYRPRALADAPEVEIGSFLPGTTVATKSMTAGAVQQPTPDRDSETPMFVSRVVAGLTRLTFRAPTDSSASQVFIGYFQLKRTRLPVVASTYWGLGGVGVQVFDPEANEGRAAILGFGFSERLRMLIDVAVPNGGGVFLWAGRVFSDGSGGALARRQGMVLARNGTNIQLLQVQFTVNAVTVDVLATAAFAWDEFAREFVVNASVVGSDFVLQVTPSNTPAAPAISITRPVTQAPWTLGGHFGALYKSYGVSANAGRARAVLLELSQA